MNNSLIVAAIQMSSSISWQDNLTKAKKLINDAASLGAKVIVLPEFFIRIANPLNNDLSSIGHKIGEGKIQEELSIIARDNHVFLVAGTLPIKAEDTDKHYNTALVYNPNGELICYYHKIHLFKFNNNDTKFDEGTQFVNGNEVKAFTVDNFTFGLGICYDLRFPELFRQAMGIDAFIIPAAFIHITGKDHWEILLRARAIENQCYIIAANQTGIHESGRHSFGHSMIIDPWGTVREIIKDGEGIISYLITKSEIQKIRAQLPALAHCRIK